MCRRRAAAPARRLPPSRPRRLTPGPAGHHDHDNGPGRRSPASPTPIRLLESRANIPRKCIFFESPGRPMTRNLKGNALYKVENFNLLINSTLMRRWNCHVTVLSVLGRCDCQPGRPNRADDYHKESEGCLLRQGHQLSRPRRPVLYAVHSRAGRGGRGCSNHLKARHLPFRMSSAGRGRRGGRGLNPLHTG